MKKVKIPPIKIQGIKTKLVPWIESILPDEYDRWIEPFAGSGVVGFNIPENEVLINDINPHIIEFYNYVQAGEITGDLVREFLEFEGKKLEEKGEEYYYLVRRRFNAYKQPLDFLFLNRSCFNGLIRFNKKAEFNVPFCKKEKRFSKAYITKIVNQVNFVSEKLKNQKYSFLQETFDHLICWDSQENDLIYVDPPYIDRSSDYYTQWSSFHEELLFRVLSECKSKFILSTWHHNKYRKNKSIDKYWNQFNIYTKEHFYHVGAKESNRSSMIEAIVTNF